MAPDEERTNHFSKTSSHPVGHLSETADFGFSFGTFRIFPNLGRLFDGEKPVKLGSRSFEILVALVEREGGLVTRDELKTRVWPRTIVEEHNIQVQISALRKALGAGRGIVQTEAGRGYRLAVPINKIIPTSALAVQRPLPPTNLPTPVSKLIGREAELAELQHIMTTCRFVTLTGGAGVGKTQLALAVARLALPSFADGVWVVELGTSKNLDHVIKAIEGGVGIELARSSDPADELVSRLKRRNLLLILNNCEHLVDCIARTVEQLLHRAPSLRILATSQQRLAADGERLYRVMPLMLPTSNAGLDLSLRSGAVQLFIQHVHAAGVIVAQEEHTVAVITKICRRLDGVPLAIELAAAQAANIGIETLAQRLDDRFLLLTEGRRTALDQQKTLRAALDWSWQLLTDCEGTILRRLALLEGDFTLHQACCIAADDSIDEKEAIVNLAGLVRKSLLTVEGQDTDVRYRLYETTRLYALEKLALSGEIGTVRRRYSSRCPDFLAGVGSHLSVNRTAEIVVRYRSEKKKHSSQTRFHRTPSFIDEPLDETAGELVGNS